MANKSKRDGTGWQLKVRRRLEDAGLVVRVLPEGGVYDEGDLEVLTDQRYVLECRQRQAMNVHEAVKKARRKVGGSPFVAVVWRRFYKKEPEKARRREAGEPVVAIPLPLFIYLLHRDAGDSRTDSRHAAGLDGP